MANVQLSKRILRKDQFDWVNPTNQTVTASAILPSVDEFFNYYNQIFYEIPKTGDVNSHEYLISVSQEYVGSDQSQPEIDALIQEVNGLRQVISEQQELILNLTVSGSK